METLVKRNSLLPLIPTTNLIDDLFSRDIFDWTDRNFSSIGSNLPSVNLKETDTKLQVELAAPGMKKEDFKVEIDNNTLLISSEKEEETEEDDDGEYKPNTKFKVNDTEGEFDPRLKKYLIPLMHLRIHMILQSHSHSYLLRLRFKI